MRNTKSVSALARGPLAAVLIGLAAFAASFLALSYAAPFAAFAGALSETARVVGIAFIAALIGQVAAGLGECFHQWRGRGLESFGGLCRGAGDQVSEGRPGCLPGAVGQKGPKLIANLVRTLAGQDALGDEKQTCSGCGVRG